MLALIVIIAIIVISLVGGSALSDDIQRHKIKNRYREYEAFRILQDVDEQCYQNIMRRERGDLEIICVPIWRKNL